MDIRALTFKDNILIPEISDTTIALTGQAKLIQRVIKCLLTIPGSDRFDPEFGVGVQKVLPDTYDDRQLEQIKMNVTEAIINAEKQIKEEDSIANWNEDEKLGYLSLRELKFDQAQALWIIELNLRDLNNVNVVVDVGVK